MMSKLRNDRLTLSQVLDLLDADDPGPAICNIAVVPKTEKDAIESDCDSDASDMDFTGDSAHLPSRILNSTAELFGSDHFEEVEPACEDQPNFTIRTRSLTKKLEAASSSLLLSSDATTATIPVPKAESISAHLIKRNNKSRHFRKSKKPAKSHLPDYIVYEPTAAQCLKATNANPLDVFLAMYPPSLRQLTIEMSNLYKILSVDESMIPYYGRHGYKQFIKGKPIRYATRFGAWHPQGVTSTTWSLMLECIPFFQRPG
ncbi:uncharacterized protein LOC107757911 [Sinocyclocheilus rhinocerous]|uniref:uncharacterized protein LOC107757911 n=1 Tax=Sinocyclocheilus rhinocerous TaxID=307959 RepID=UPI0007B7AB74|nr:PREDICTED: uncharacterized protein LOC107757911 [Sinocyclocheilus rhinocerous]